MDGDRFDTLARSLTASGSRRRALALALSGALAPLLGPWETEAHETLKKCKKKSGKQKKKCLKKAKAHNATHVTQTPAGCTPNCPGTGCGSDGCGGSCSSCTDSGGTCTGGTCNCPSGTVLCRGNCVSACPTNRTLDPDECTCCKRAPSNCGADDECCSGVCPSDGECDGLKEGEQCRFPEQCNYEICTDGFCRCPSGTSPCEDGWCTWVCAPGWIHPPDRCHCCIPNGSSCVGESINCCAGWNQCTGANTTCVGRPNGQECDFDAQCASGECQLNGLCGGGIEQ